VEGGAVNGGEFALHPAPMMDLEEAARGANGRVQGRTIAFAGVTTDSRAICAGDLFVALKGERFDGHAYVAEAFRRGAAAAMTSHGVEAVPPIPQLIVDDTRLALGRLAAHWRGRFTLPVVALTGSNGKTTVKEMLAAILAAHCGNAQAVLATEGNLNNDVGMPLTLLKLRERHRYAVIEMGMNHAGEIDYLTRIARPHIAIVNNAQRAHVGLLGSLRAIAAAKGEIYAGLDASGIALVNADEPFAAYWRELNAGRRVVTFGLSDAADVRAARVDDEARFVTPTDAFSIRLQVAGEHNVRNAAAACAAAYALDISTRAIQDGLAHFRGVPGRLQRRAGLDGALVIDDSYNANPESMTAAVQVLAEEKGRRVLVMGDMGELGEEAPAMHAEVGAFAASRGIEVLLALGDFSRHAAAAFGSGARHFTDVEEAIRAARALAARDTAFLVKGSRFMRMERVADALAADGGADAL
jgi:UDP-N-acetylmuramoyl-tripeptide--D-alanyl-D-alanine ligase